MYINQTIFEFVASLSLMLSASKIVTIISIKAVNLVIDWNLMRMPNMHYLLYDGHITHTLVDLSATPIIFDIFLWTAAFLFSA